MLYLIPLPPNKAARRGRVLGWSHVKLDRESTARLNDSVKRLSDKPVKKLYAADIHEHAVLQAAKQLHSERATMYRLRPFNVGRQAGRKREDVDTVLSPLVNRWKTSPIIPMPGGDSWISFRRRFVETALMLLRESQDETWALLLDPREIAVLRAVVKHEAAEDMLLSRHHVSGDKIYILRWAPVGTPSREASLGTASAVAANPQ